ncbi:MAG: DUF5716 family protein [Lachnospiraceae bacterium]
MDQITYFGLDLGEEYSQISFYRDSMEEPVSISTHVGSQSYLIPTVVAKKPGVGQWFIGEEALRIPGYLAGILSKAYRKETLMVESENVQAVDLLLLFIRRVLSQAAVVGCDKRRDVFVFSVDHVSTSAVETLLTITTRLDIPREHVKICGKKESFVSYVMKQDPVLYRNEVLLLDYWKNSFHAYVLQKNKTYEPAVISVEEISSYSIQAIFEADQKPVQEQAAYKDQCLFSALDEFLGNRLLSSVYLVGDGFEGDWMKKSLSRLCSGRRVFFGMNLYTKGACYFGKQSSRPLGDHPEYLYLGGGNLLFHFCLLVYYNGESHEQVLLGAGSSWQEAKGAVEIILAGDEEPVLHFVLRSIQGNQKKEIPKLLSGLTITPDKTTRLRVEASALSRDRLLIVIRTLGFGEVAPSPMMEWKFEIDLKEET